MLHLTILTYFVVHRIQPHNAVNRLQRTVLPGFDLGGDTVGNLRENRVGDLTVVHLLDVGADIAQAHLQSIQANDFGGKEAFPLFDNLWRKLALPVLGRVDLEGSLGAFDRLGSFTVAFDATLTLLLV